MIAYDLSVIARRLAAALLGAALALGACSDDPAKPRTVDSLTPTPTSSPTPVPTSSAALAAEAEAAVRAYYAAATAALGSGDTTELARRSISTCGCRALITYIEEKWAAGSIVGGRFELSTVEVLQAAAAVGDVRVIYDVSSYEVRNSSGKRIELVPAEHRESIVRLVKTATSSYLFAEVRPVQ